MKEGGGVGCTNACICIGTHSQPLLQNRFMDVYKTWYAWRDHGPAHALRCFGQICPGAAPGRGQNRSRGPLLQETSSSDPKATATNWIHSNDLEACVMKSCFLVPFRSQFFSPPRVKPGGTIGLHSVRLSICQSVCPSVTLVFRTFLLHPLTYRAEILYMILFNCTTDQVRLALLCVNFCMSYAPFWT